MSCSCIEKGPETGISLKGAFQLSSLQASASLTVLRYSHHKHGEDENDDDFQDDVQ